MESDYLLNVIAEALEYQKSWYNQDRLGYWIPEEGGIRDWNPWDDDRDAFRLLVTFQLKVEVYSSVVCVTYKDLEYCRQTINPEKTNAREATRHAIVYAVVEQIKSCGGDVRGRFIPLTQS